MSQGFQKFERTDAWFSQLKEFLERPPQPKQVSQTTESKPNRYSLDFDEEFKNILEEKAIPKRFESKMEQNKENVPTVANDSFCSNYSRASKMTSYYSHNDSTVLENDVSLWRQTSDASFEQIEKMCDKTLSGPNRNQSLSALGICDQTQLNDIEEPSLMWENTIREDGPRVSPVKMVGLLRPSTILEETVSFTESEDTSVSFQTAQKMAESSETCFETANETLATQRDISKNLFQSCAKKQIFFDETSSSTSTVTSKNTLDDVSSLMQDSSTASKLTGRSIEETSIIELSDSDESGEDNSGSLNCGFSHIDEDQNKSDDDSLQFNDTLEEMEHIMKKGQEYMSKNNGGAIPKTVENSPYKFNLPRPVQPVSASAIKPPPTIPLFKKPISKIPQSKSNPNHHNFGHIVSPVRAYIKHTPSMPTIVNAKILDNLYQSKAMQKIEFDSRGKEKADVQATASSTAGARGACYLPKKAYISAEFKHVTDVRKPVTIPGGNKIQRLLHKPPSVIRHDGKLKMDMNGGKRTVAAAAPVNDSLADLSLMSGDVSLLTIMDAKKI